MTSTSWRIDCAVTLTDPERQQFRRWQAASLPQPNGWWLWAQAMGVGLLTGLIAVTFQMASLRAGGGIAVIGFASCWAGIDLQARHARRADQRHRDRAWQEIGGGYGVVLHADGIAWSIHSENAISTTQLAWPAVSSITRHGDVLVIRTRRGTVLPIPERCLPPDYPADTILALTKPHVTAA